MAGPVPTSKKMSDYLPNLKQEGIPYLVGAYEGGVSIQYGQITQAGASAFAVTFAALGMSDMADALYIPFVTGPNGDERADLSTRTTTGFDIVGGADTEVLGVMVVGRIRGQAT